jgi:hypothetical protein
VCTYQTQTLSLRGSAKTPEGWTAMTDASVYFDHPVHYPAGHALLIDVLNPAKGPSARVALELSAESARDLANAILRSLDAVPSELISDSAS